MSRFDPMKRWSLSAGMTAAWLGSGCAVHNEDILDFLQAHKHMTSAIEYRLGVPDVMLIDAPHVLEIHGQSQRIQPDGKINLKLVGEVKVVGMTAKEVAAKLQTLLSKYYLDPKVNVRVVGYESKKYHVVDEAGGLEAFPYTGRDTVLDAVTQAGISFMAWTSRVSVIRGSHKESERRKIVVDVDRMIKEGDYSANILIEPGDVVVIPPTPLAWLGLRVRELLFPVHPAMEAYTTPARVMAAQDEYDDDDDDGGRGDSALLNRLR